MSRRSAFRNRAEYAAALLVVKSLEWTPLAVARPLARLYVRLLDLALPRLRRVAARNLELAMPNLPPARRKQIVDGVFRSIARVLLAFARFPRIGKANLNQWIRAEGAGYFEEAIRRRKGVFFATAHLGNWELSAYAHAYLTGPMNVVVRPLDNPLLDAFVERRRSLSGNRILSKRDYARAILKALNSAEAVGVLLDQNVAAENSVFVDFFGVPACTGTGFARIAYRSGAVVIPGFALWEESEQRHVLRFYPPITMTGDPAADTQALQSKLEEIIRRYPDQWLWIHRRWKTRPPGEESLYQSL